MLKGRLHLPQVSPLITGSLSVQVWHKRISFGRDQRVAQLTTERISSWHIKQLIVDQSFLFGFSVHMEDLLSCFNHAFGFAVMEKSDISVWKLSTSADPSGNLN